MGVMIFSDKSVVWDDGLAQTLFILDLNLFILSLKQLTLLILSKLLGPNLFVQMYFCRARAKPKENLRLET